MPLLGQQSQRGHSGQSVAVRADAFHRLDVVNAALISFVKIGHRVILCKVRNGRIITLHNALQRVDAKR